MKEPHVSLDSLEEQLSRRRFLTYAASTAAVAGAALAAGPGAAGALAKAGKQAGPKIDLGRNQQQKILDAVVDICAETGYVSLSPRLIARRSGVPIGPVKRLYANEEDFVGKTMERLFYRRIQTYYANAAKLDSATTSAQPGINTLARMFPDPIWIAYWDILFAIRNKPKVQKRVQDVTNNYDSQFVEIVPRFFPPSAPENEVNFCFIHFDALGLEEVATNGKFPRNGQLVGLAHILEGRL